MARDPELTSVDIKKDVANLVHTYCVFNQIKMKDFASQVLEDNLKEFKEKLEKMARIGG